MRMALFGRESARDQEKVQAWREWFQRQHPLALTSIVLSVFSISHLGTLIFDELLGIVIGIVAIRRANRTPGLSTRLAYFGIVIGVLSLICAVIVYTRKRM